MEVCISGWNSTCQPYIESTTLLSDYYDEELQEFFVFFWAAKRHFQRLAGPINVSGNLKYDVLCLRVLCMAYPSESGEVTA